MNEMIDRVARALCEAEGDRDELWDAYLEPARAAIEAMREPTKEMLFAGDLHCTYGCKCWSGDIYPAMIDAALEDKKEAGP